MKKALQKALPLLIKHNIIPFILCSAGLYNTLQTTHPLDLKIYLFMCSCMCSLANESARISCEWLNRTESKHIFFMVEIKGVITMNAVSCEMTDYINSTTNIRGRHVTSLSGEWLFEQYASVAIPPRSVCNIKKGGEKTSAAKTKRPRQQG